MSDGGTGLSVGPEHSPMSDRSSDDLRHLLDDLSHTLDALRDELDEGERRRGRSGGRGADRNRDGEGDRPRERGRRRGRDRDGDRGSRPEPPGSGRFLEFTEEYTIPTLISFLETNIRALELLQGLLGLLNGSGESRSDRRQFEAVGERTMDQLDGLLGDLQGAIEGEPTDPTARDLLAEARSLRREIDDRIAGRSSADGERPRDGRDRDRDRRERDERSVSIEVTDADGGDSSTEDATDGSGSADDEVDVEGELDSIRREVHGDRAGGEGDDESSPDDSE